MTIIAPGGKVHPFKPRVGFLRKEDEQVEVILLRFSSEPFDAACARAEAIMADWKLNGNASLDQWKQWIRKQDLDRLDTDHRDWEFVAPSEFPLCTVRVRWALLKDYWVVEWQAALNPAEVEHQARIRAERLKYGHR